MTAAGGWGLLLGLDEEPEQYWNTGTRRQRRNPLVGLYTPQQQQMNEEEACRISRATTTGRVMLRRRSFVMVAALAGKKQKENFLDVVVLPGRAAAAGEDEEAKPMRLGAVAIFCTQHNIHLAGGPSSPRDHFLLSGCPSSPVLSARSPQKLEHSFRQYALLLNPFCRPAADVTIRRSDCRKLTLQGGHEPHLRRTLKLNTDFLEPSNAALTPGPLDPLRRATSLRSGERARRRTV